MIGDIYNIEDRLQELDPDITLDFDFDKEEYKVSHKGSLVMYWPRPLDERLIRHMRKIDVRRKGYDPLHEVIEHNEKLEKAQDKARYDLLDIVTRERRSFIRDEIDGLKMKHVFKGGF